MSGIYDIAKLSDFVTEFKLLNELLSDDKKVKKFIEASAEIKQTLELRNTLQAKSNELAQTEKDIAKAKSESDIAKADIDSRLAILDKKEIDYAAKKSIFDGEKRETSRLAKKLVDDTAALEAREIKLVELEAKVTADNEANAIKQQELDGLIAQYKLLLKQLAKVSDIKAA